MNGQRNPGEDDLPDIDLAKFDSDFAEHDQVVFKQAVTRFWKLILAAAARQRVESMA